MVGASPVLAAAVAQTSGLVRLAWAAAAVAILADVVQWLLPVPADSPAVVGIGLGPAASPVESDVQMASSLAVLEWLAVGAGLARRPAESVAG
jgi:hypothetical protein